NRLINTRSPITTIGFRRIEGQIALSANSQICFQIVKREVFRNPTGFVFNVITIFILHEFIYEFISEGDTLHRRLSFSLECSLRLQAKVNDLYQTSRIDTWLNVRLLRTIALSAFYTFRINSQFEFLY